MTVTMPKPKWPADHINHYGNLQFVRVCRVREDNVYNWYYEDINRVLMFSNHRSWVYVITVNGIIVKIGETGQPLGIENQHWTTDPAEWESQPKKGSMSRCGRYRNGDTTDDFVRASLRARIASGDLVEFWAIECPETSASFKIVNETIEMKSQYHKQLEVELLDYFYKSLGKYPELNKGRK